MKKIRDKIWEALDKNGRIYDQQAADIYGGEEGGIIKVLEHVRAWRKMRADQQFFSGKKIVAKMKGYRCHMVRIDTEPENSWYKVGKEFYDSCLV